MEFLVRLIQIHETFREPELKALARLAGVDLEIVAYSKYSPYCIIRLPSIPAARAFISRSILSKAIYELWATGPTYPALHADLRARSSHDWLLYKNSSFKFSLDHYQGHRSATAQRTIIESFSYIGLEGPIKMSHPDEEFVIFEDYDFGSLEPKQLFVGRFIAPSDRDAIVKYSLKTREYISTTSMDSELALVTANLTLASPGKLFYDPFVGTGSFPIACSHFGAVSMGSDIDGRSLRGRRKKLKKRKEDEGEGEDGSGGGEKNVVTSFRQYGLSGRYLDGFISDLTHSPLRSGKGERFLDGILCDPPYGVREGLKVLGSKHGSGKEPVFIDGKAAHLQDDHIPPKKPYSFEAMLDDILEFAAVSLVDEGRLSLWMPTANDEEVEFGVPSHPCLEVVSMCVQSFNKWSRRLLTYRRKMVGDEVYGLSFVRSKERVDGGTADDLNNFRKRYFEGFKPTLAPDPITSTTEPTPNASDTK